MENKFTPESEQIKEDLKESISGFGIRAELGVMQGGAYEKFLAGKFIPREDATAAMTEFLSGKNYLKVNETPLMQLSTKEREDTAGSYEQWEEWMDDWIKPDGKDQTTTQYADRKQIISILSGVGEGNYATQTATENTRKTMIASIHTGYFENTTNILGLTEAFITSAKDPTTNEVSMDKLKRQLKAMQPFLSSCGEESTVDAIKQHILLQGAAQADDKTKDALIKIAPEQINKLMSKKEISTIDTLRAYAQSNQAEDNRRQNLPENATQEQTPAQPAPDVPKPVEGEGQVEKKIQMISATATEKKSSHRNNQDAEFHNDTNRAYGAFDGVSEAGEIGGEAARTASPFVEKALASFPDKLSPDFSEEDAKEEMRLILLDAHQEVYDEGMKNEGRWNAGMSTTASVVKVLEDGTAIIGKVGDSRVYVLRKSRLHEAEALEQLTLDHTSSFSSEQEDFAKQKRLSNVTSEGDFIDDDDRTAFKHRNQVGYVLGETDSSFHFLPIEPQVRVTKLEEGDILLLTTDGIHDNLTDKEIEAYLRKNQADPSTASKELVQQAKAISEKPKEENMRAKPDDITATVAVVKK